MVYDRSRSIAPPYHLCDGPPTSSPSWSRGWSETVEIIVTCHPLVEKAEKRTLQRYGVASDDTHDNVKEYVRVPAVSRRIDSPLPRLSL